MKAIGAILTVILLVAIVGVGLYMVRGGDLGSVFQKGKVGSPLTTYGNTTSSNSMEFGTSIDVLDDPNAEWSPKYLSIGAGDWIAHDPYGWQTFDDWLNRIYSADATPVILWYYWGNDTTMENIQNGVGTKSVDEWYNMTSMMGDSIARVMGDNGAIVVVEPEFNKHGTENWTEFNDHLVEISNILHSKNANIKVVIGFGNWDNEKWADFTDAVVAADMVGYNGVARYPDNSQTDYENVVLNSVAASQYLQTIFPGKPIIWYDFGASSAPEPDYYYEQQAVMQSLLENREELEEAGTEIVMYKHYSDQIQFVGPQDQHWGLVDSSFARKPAYETWIRVVNRENVTQESNETV